MLLRDRRERAAVMAAMWEHSVDTSTIYSGVVQVSRKFGYRGGCPVAESVADRLITLPNHAALSGSDIETVAQVFRSSLSAWRNTRPSYPVLTFGVSRKTEGVPAASSSPLKSATEPQGD